MNRRSFLFSSAKGVVLGAALSSGFAPTRIRAVNEYEIVYSFTDKLAELYEDELPGDIVSQAIQRMHIIAEMKEGDIVRYEPVFTPCGQKDMSDPLGQKGYFGINFSLEQPFGADTTPLYSPT